MATDIQARNGVNNINSKLVTSYQPLDPDLTAIAALTTPATTITGAAQKSANLSDLASANTAKSNLGLVIGTNVQAWDADLDAVAALTAPATTITGSAQKSANLSDLGSASTARTNLGLTIGTNVQAYNTDLAAIAALTPTNGDLIERVGGAWVNRSQALLKQDLGVPYVLASSAVAQPHTGDTALTTLATVSVPGNTLGNNGWLRITSIWSWTSNANTKTNSITFGGATFMSRAETTSGFHRDQITIQNRNAANSQVGPASGIAGGFGLLSGSPTTSAIDTTTSQNLLFRTQLGNSGDTATLESWIVEVYYSA